jgi:hypothetical protein
MEKNNYSHYTSQGASLQQAQTAHASWAKSNKQSFFNLNNAMGLFKIFLIVGVIIVVVIVLSPLFALLKGMFGAAQAGFTLIGDFLKSCISTGSCVYPTTKKRQAAATEGVCDPAIEGIPPGEQCKAASDCGTKFLWLSWCSVLGLGWLIGMGPFMAFCGEVKSWFKRRRESKEAEKEKKLKEAQEAEGNNPEISDDIWEAIREGKKSYKDIEKEYVKIQEKNYTGETDVAKKEKLEKNLEELGIIKDGKFIDTDKIPPNVSDKLTDYQNFREFRAKMIPVNIRLDRVRQNFRKEHKTLK